MSILRGIPRLAPNAIVTGADFNMLVDAVRSALRLSVGPGLNMSVSSMGTLISLADYPIDQRNTSASGISSSFRVVGIFMARIEGSEPINEVGGNQWRYLFSRVKKTSQGYGGWEVEEYDHTLRAYNGAEVPNSPFGVQGTGIDVDNLPGTFAHQPIPSGVIVPMFIIARSDSMREYWFCVPNGVDGTCEEVQ